MHAMRPADDWLPGCCCKGTHFTAAGEASAELQRLGSAPSGTDDMPYGQVGRLRERFGGTPSESPRQISPAAGLPGAADARWHTVCTMRCLANRTLTARSTLLSMLMLMLIRPLMPRCGLSIQAWRAYTSAE